MFLLLIMSVILMLNNVKVAIRLLNDILRLFKYNISCHIDASFTKSMLNQQIYIPKKKMTDMYSIDWIIGKRLT